VPVVADLRRPPAAAHVRALWSFTGRYRVLHLTWCAFFLSFVVWFNFAPFAGTIRDQLGLTEAEIKTIGLCNVALTVPARIFVGMALDRWGPRRVYAAILVGAVVPNTAFALSSSFEALVVSRLALSVVGAGFVVGIRMVSEWFPPREVGTAEGVYGGWGNFGAAAAAALPLAVGWLGGDDGWRWAIGATGVVAAAFGLVYLRSVTDTPEGVSYARPRRQGALEVTQRSAVWGLAALTAPLAGALGLVAWRIWREGVVGDAGLAAVVAVVVGLLVFQERAVFRVNRPALAGRYPADDRYPFRNVAALCAAYFAAFGSELAVVTILPTFFAETWGLGPTAAGLAASAYAFMNLVARPAGGVLSDVLGSRRRTLSVLCAGLVAGYALMATMGSAWPWLLAVAVCMACSFFVQATNGAVFAIVPLVKKRVSGQVAGMTGAYGNVGALVFLTIGIVAPTRVVFVVMAVASIGAFVASRAVVEPDNSFAAELLTDGAPGEAAVLAGRATPVGALAPDAGAVDAFAPEPVPALAD
jgi:MFS transporter, NNP family, nitrate/nitrite transporter